MNITIEQFLVAATGVSYAIFGGMQLSKGEIANAMIWSAYAFAQVGLLMNLR